MYRACDRKARRRRPEKNSRAPSSRENTRMRYSLVLILCIVLSAPANAQQRGGVVGVSGGGFRFEDRDDALAISVSDSALSYGVFGGYRFSNSFAVEGSWNGTTDFNDIFDEIFQALPIIGGFVT